MGLYLSISFCVSEMSQEILSGSSADLCLQGGLIEPWPATLTLPTEYIRHFLQLGHYRIFLFASFSFIINYHTIFQ